MTLNEVGKRELCEKLKWSRPTLDARLKADPNFPVKQVGGRGGGWVFDVQAVRSYLLGAPAGELPLGPEVEEAAGAAPERDLVVSPHRRMEHSGEASATQRLKNAQADAVEDKLRRSRGELIEAAEAREVMSIIMAEFKSFLGELPGVIGKEFDLSDRVQHGIRLKVEAAQRSVATRIRGRLTDA